ncbi:MAG: DUF401 family protein [Desulfurococcaceae archaeon]
MGLGVLALFAFSMAIALALIFLGVDVLLSLGLAYALFSALALGPRWPSIFVEYLNYSMLNTVLSLLSALFLANLYKDSEASTELVAALEALSPRAAAVGIPAVIGLLPMPAGAYISATMVNGLYESMGLSAEERTFVNFWYRHIWQAVWPLYQGVILASSILNKSYLEILSSTWPIPVAAAAAGLMVFGRRLFSGARRLPRRDAPARWLVHVWPFPAVALLAFATPLPLFVAVLAVSAAFVAVYRPSRRQIVGAAKRTIDLSLVAIAFVSLEFGGAVTESGLAGELAGALSGVAPLALVLVPLAIVVATGFEFTYVALTFPVLAPLMQGPGLTLAFLGGYLGSMLSPSHLCLVMSAKYFGASVPRTYKLIGPAALAMALLVIPAALALGF